MSNREQYKRAFQALHASRDFSMEAMDMNTKKMRFNFSRGLAVAMIITVLLVGSLSAAYATDLGGFRRTIQICVDVECDGEATMAEPSYVVTWTDGNGEKHQMQGGGVAMEADGTERPLTMDEYLEHLESSAETVVEVDDRVMLYWYDQSVDITDQFEDGVCRLSLTHEDETLYFTVTDAGNGAYNVSAGSDSYVD